MLITEATAVLKKAIDEADKTEHSGRAALVFAAGLYPPGDQDVSEDELYQWLVGSEVYRLIIFNTSFCEALYGIEPVCPVCGSESTKAHPAAINCSALTVAYIPAYEFHRREMIVESDPLMYIKDHLESSQ